MDQENTNPATEVDQSAVSDGDDRSIMDALKARRTKAREAPTPQAAPEKPDKPKAEVKPEQKTAEPKVPTAEKEGPAPERAEEEQPEKADEKVEPEPESPGEDAEPRYKVSVDGKEEEVTLTDLRGGYMRQKDYTLKTQRLAEERNQFHDEVRQYSSLRDNTLNELAVLSQEMVRQLTEENRSGSLEELRNTDPAEFAARVASRTQKQEMLRRVLATANRARQDEAEKRQKHQDEQSKRYRNENENRLTMAVPEWADQAVRQKARAEINDFLKGRGYNDEEVSSLVDHRTVLLARDAMRYHRMLEAKAKATAEKRAAESTKPADKAPAERADSGTAKLEAARAAAAKSGSLDSVAAYLRQKRKLQNRR